MCRLACVSLGFLAMILASTTSSLAEVAVLPLAFGAWQIAVVFSVLNGAMLAWRIRIEDRTLAERRDPGI